MTWLVRVSWDSTEVVSHYPPSFLPSFCVHITRPEFSYLRRERWVFDNLGVIWIFCQGDTKKKTV